MTSNNKKNIVLVHGIFDRGENFHQLEGLLKKEGHNCISPTLTPNDGSAKIQTLARQLKSVIDKKMPYEENENPYIFIGFSMGCLITRIYFSLLEKEEKLNRVQSFFAISSPHKGTITAHLHNSPAAKQMRPKSPFLKILNKKREYTFPVHTYWTPLDFMIFPPTNSIWKEGENTNTMVWTQHHGLMTSNSKVCKDIIKKVKT